MRLTSAEDALMLRQPYDEQTRQHERMLKQLLPIASCRTLQGAVSTVRSAHTLCGSSLLAEAEAVLTHLRKLEEADAVEAFAPSPVTIVPMPPLRPCEASLACPLRLDISR